MQELLNNVFSQIENYMPTIIIAFVVLLVGWVVALILSYFIKKIIVSTAFNKKLESLFTKKTKGKIEDKVAKIFFCFVMLLVLLLVFEILGVAIATGLMEVLFKPLSEFLPEFFGATLLLLFAWGIAKVQTILLGNVLDSFGFNKLPEALGLGISSTDSKYRPSKIVGDIVFLTIMLFASMEAAIILGLDAISELIDNFIGFGFNLLLAAITLVIGLYFAKLLKDLVLSSGGKYSLALSRFVYIVVASFSGVMAFEEIGIAESIINMAFGIILGSFGIACAISLGLGTKDIVSREFDLLLSKFRE